MSGTSADLPPHVEETMRAISRLHTDHRRGAEGLQRLCERLTRFFSQPRFIALITFAILAWLVADAFESIARIPTFDPWPLQGLQVLTSVAALYMTLFILTAQRREDELEELREQLTLQMSIASEQKIAKVIELLEELRRDLPSVHNRTDANAVELSRPADPDAVLEVLRERQHDLRQSNSSEQGEGL